MERQCAFAYTLHRVPAIQSLTACRSRVLSCGDSVAETCEHVGELVSFFSQGKLELTAPITAGEKTQY